MTEYPRHQHGPDCTPTKDSAPQPKQPGDDCGELPKSTPSTPPTLETEKCPPPDPCCKCPTPPTSTPDCLEKLIVKEAEQAAAGQKADAFKKDLDKLLTSAKAAAADYTRSKYDEYVKSWEENDRRLAELIGRVECNWSCWRCVIECYVCPLINEVVYAERRLRLYDEIKLYDKVWDLYDLRYWHQCDRDAKQRKFDRIKQVLQAWEKPAATIKANLDLVSRWIGEANKALGDGPKVIYDVFLRILPLHLATAPPSTKSTTSIGKQYTEFCTCDEPKPDDCCGPDVGQWSVRQRLVGPQPYLIDPNDYFAVICCLVEKRYGPAKDAVAEASARYQSVDEEISRYEKLIKDRLDPKTFEAAAKGAIPSVVDCCGPAMRKDEPSPGQAQAR